MNAKLTDIPDDVREKLVKQGLLPPQLPHKRQTSDKPSNKTHERLASAILTFWLSWCHWCGIVGAGIVGILLVSLVIGIVIWMRKGN